MMGAPEPPAEIVETHVSVIALIGDRAFKLLKPVAMGFLDHRLRVDRLAACRRETEVNRRFAPDVYLGVLDVAGEDGRPRDHLVEMRRMPASRRLSALLAAPEAPELVREVARLVAGFHRAAPDLRPHRARGEPRRGARALGGGARPAGRDRSGRGRARGDRARPQALPRLPHRPGAAARAPHRRRAGYATATVTCSPTTSSASRTGPACSTASRSPTGCGTATCSATSPSSRWTSRPTGTRTSAASFWPSGGGISARTIRPRSPTTTSPTAPTSAPRSPPSARRRAIRARARAHGRCRICRCGTSSARRCGWCWWAEPRARGRPRSRARWATRAGWEVIGSDETRKDAAGLPRAPGDPGAFEQGLYAPGVTGVVYDEIVAARLGAPRAAASTSCSTPRGVTRAAARRRGRRHGRRGARLVEIECRLEPGEAAARITRRRAAGQGASDATPEIAARLAAGSDPWPEALALDTGPPPDLVLQEALRLAGAGRC